MLKVVFKGIWYLGYTDVVPYQWGTFCASYSENHTVSMAYKVKSYNFTTLSKANSVQGSVIFTKSDPAVLGPLDWRDPVPASLVLGAGSTSTAVTFAGRLTNLRVWSRAAGGPGLAALSGCPDGESGLGPPDLLDWVTRNY